MAEGYGTDLDRLEARVTDLVIRLILLGLFAWLSFAIVRPFLPMLVWAVILAVALAPLHERLATGLGGRRRLSAALIALLLLALVAGPAAALAANLADSAQALVARLRSESVHLPDLPASVADWPLAGPRIDAAWSELSSNLDGFVSTHREALVPLVSRLVALLSTVGLDLLKFLVSAVIAGLLLVPGPALAHCAGRVVSRVVSPRGAEFVALAAMTIRNVSRGVVGVALLQSLAIGVVLLAFGLPNPGLLAFLILILCILQVGPAPVVLPVLIWAWSALATGQALLLTALLVPLTLMDNLLKPILMGRGLRTPTLVIFLGVLGGTLGFGLTGLFLGPVVLAVCHDLVVTWLNYEDPAPEGR
ncbi:AI-2E family transporter [Salipiger sp. H15]|uniref:AI-2E family transporter n=1 Tax=Alloyangia sp. H15 TaxID=3029062 RepID=A0AAU8AEF2_9RHOB